MNYVANRWEVKYSILNENIEPQSTINTIERTAIIRNIPAQVDEEGVEISPADNQLDEFRDQIVSAGLLDEASEQEAINHAETIGIFVEYVDPTEDAWDEEIPEAPPEEETDPWVEGVFVALGMVRTYEGESYRVRQPHTTQANWTPDVTPALWKLLPQSGGSGLDLWLAGTNYLVGGEEVEHNGEQWRNRRANNTQQLAPGVNQSGWMQISNTPAPWYGLGNEGYPAGWQVTLSGTTYESNIDNNFWQPPTQWTAL
jgi:hypothetical protein